jgi:hypothetical protein
MRRYVQEVQVMAVPQDPKGNDSRRYLRRTLYRYRYLVIGIVLAAIVGQIAFGYASASSQVDLSSGGVADWPQYGRDQEGTRYTPLDQINRGNVSYLRKAWEYHTGDFSDGSDGRPETTFQASEDLGCGSEVPRYGRTPMLAWVVAPSTAAVDRDLHGCQAACRR